MKKQAKTITGALALSAGVLLGMNGIVYVADGCLYGRYVRVCTFDYEAQAETDAQDARIAALTQEAIADAQQAARALDEARAARRGTVGHITVRGT